MIWGDWCFFFLWGEQRKFIEAWADQVVREPRMAALLEDSAVKLLAKAESILKDTSSESQRQTFTLVKRDVLYVKRDLVYVKRDLL